MNTNQKKVSGFYVVYFKIYLWLLAIFKLKMISSRTANSWEFVCVFCFASCKTSQNVNTLQQLTWNKFKVSKQPPLRMQSGQSFKPCYFSYYLISYRHGMAKACRLWTCGCISQTICCSICGGVNITAKVLNRSWACRSCGKCSWHWRRWRWTKCLCWVVHACL